jgi:hypothetical protein
MRETRSYGGGPSWLACTWLLLFIALKVDGVPQIAAWSWWWVLLSPLPIFFEVVKAVLT